MKTFRIFLVVALAALFSSCNAPIVNRALNLPGGIIRKVTGPVFNSIM